MRLLILGATGRTGRAVAAQARTTSHRITAFGSRPAEDVDENPGSGFCDAAFAVRAADAVLSCLASTNRDATCSTTDPSARYLMIAGAGVDRPEDRKGVADKLIGAAMRVAARGMLADRQAKVDRLAASGTRWTMLRPLRLTEGRAIGRWTFAFDRPAATWIDRADLAGAMLEALERDDMVNRAPFVTAAP